MLRYLFVAFFLTTLTTVYAQQHQELVALYMSYKYQETIDSSLVYLHKDSTDASACEMMGEALFDLAKYDSCILMERKALLYDKGKTLISDWAHMYMGRCLYIKGDKALAKEELKKSMSKHATERMVRFSKAQLLSMGLTDEFNNWKTIERAHIIFHFQNATSPYIDQYIEKHEQAYDIINRAFNATMPKKIDYFVWSDMEKAKSNMPGGTGFTNTKFLVSHVHERQSPGHELAHTLTFWAQGVVPLTVNGFISEGLSVAFDCTGNDYYKNARESINRMFISSVAEMWKSPKLYPANIMYPVSGAFIYHLSKNSTAEQFMDIVKNQSYEHAQVVYGARLDKMIDEFDHMVGIKQ